MDVRKTLRRMAWLGAAGAVGTAAAGVGVGLMGITLWRRLTRGEDVAGKVVLITGGSRGLGLAMARELAQQRAILVICARDGDELDWAREELARTGADVLAIQCDVGNHDDVHRTVREALDRLGRIDILINNAGVISGRVLTDLTDAQIRKTFAVNTLALFWTTRAFLPGMIQRGRGHIVTIASAAGFVGAHRLTDYTASKHAAVGFDDALRAELRRVAPAVKTTVVCPFYVDTGMFAGAKTRILWLLPILKEAYAVERVIQAIERDRQRILMPRIVHVLPLLRVLPVRWFDRIIDLFGVNVSMDGFTGRPPDR
jgi:all-trans-retinol dehydrogenase (NAD+)